MIYNNNNPFISVLITCYNGEKYIEKAINSVLEQTYKNFEILFADDCSTDKSLQKIKEIAQTNSKIKILTTDTNKGVSYQRNRLINNAEGEYFLFVDIDDFLTKKAIKQLTKPIITKNTKYDLVVGKSSWKAIAKSGRVKWKISFFPNTAKLSAKENAVEYIRKNLAVVCWGMLINTKYYKGLGIEFEQERIFEDVGIMPYIYFKAKKFKAINACVYSYTRRHDSISSFKTFKYKQISDLIYQITKLLERLDNDALLNNDHNISAINSWLSVMAFMIYLLRINAKKTLSVPNNEINFVFSRYKAQFVYLILVKYKLDLRSKKSWWKTILNLLFKLDYKKEFNLIKTLYLDKKK